MISAAFANGELSFSKVRALTRIAEPQNEKELLDLALNATAAQVEKLVRAYRNLTASKPASRPTRNMPRVNWSITTTKTAAW